MSATLFATYADALPIPADGIASRPLLDMKDGTKVVLFALDQGQEISPHLSPFPASVVLLSGHMQVQVGSHVHDVLSHEEVAFPMGHPHGLKALVPSHFMLVMKRAVKDPATLRFHHVPLPGAGAESVPCPCAD